MNIRHSKATHVYEMFREGFRGLRCAPIRNLVVLSTVLLLAVQLLGDVGLTEVRLSILTGVLATALLVDRAVALRRGEELSEFEFDLIKLDRSLLQASGHPRGDRLFRKTLELARESGARVVVEGIDEERHHDVLRRHRPDFAQGYAFAPPEPVLDVLYALTAPNAAPSS